MSLCFEGDCPVSTLKDKIEQLEREVEWFANAIRACAYVINGVPLPPCPPKTTCYWEGYGPSPSADDCKSCWREAARKAVQNVDN